MPRSLTTWGGNTRAANALRGAAATGCGAAAERSISERSPSPSYGRVEAVGPGKQQVTEDAACKAADHNANTRGNTSLILRNVPYSWTRDSLIELLRSKGLERDVDFVYMPLDFDTMKSLGYAFVNLTEPCYVDRFCKAFEGFDGWQVGDTKLKCKVFFSRTQTLSGNIRRYRNSAVMSSSMPDECKPAIFSDGVRIPFPEPTHELRECNSEYRPHRGQHRNQLSTWRTRK